MHRSEAVPGGVQFLNPNVFQFGRRPLGHPRARGYRGTGLLELRFCRSTQHQRR